jgi:hypothetical protein
MNASAGLLAKMADCIADCVRLAVPQATEWEHSENQSRRAHRTVGRTPETSYLFSIYGIEWPLLVCTDCRSGLSTIPLRLISSRKLAAVTG